MSPLQQLLAITATHAYFNTGAFQEFQIEPGSATANMFRQYQFVWFREGNEYQLYVPSAFLARATKQPSLLQSLPDTLYFLFRTSWSGFAWVTLLPPLPPGDTYLYIVQLPDGSSPIASVAEGPATMLMTALQFVFPDPAVSTPAPPPKIANGEGVPLPVPMTPTSNGWSVNLLCFGPDFYYLLADCGSLTPLLADPAQMATPPQAVLVIKGFRNTVASFASGQASLDSVALEFVSRATVWNYDIFIPGNTKGRYSVKMHSIGKAANKCPQFAPVPGLQSPDGRTAHGFLSNPAQPLPLRNSPQVRCDFLLNGKVLMSPLPLPGTTLSQGPSPGTFSSQMIVYV